MGANMPTQEHVLYVNRFGYKERPHYGVSLRQRDTGRYMSFASALSLDAAVAHEDLKRIVAGIQCPRCGYWKDHPVGCGDLYCPFGL